MRSGTGYFHVSHARHAWFRTSHGQREYPQKKTVRNFSKRNPLIPTLLVFNLIGRFPFCRDDKDGSLKFKFLSLPMAWALILNLAQMVMMARIILWKVSHRRYWGTFDDALVSLQELILLSYCLHGLTASWGSTPAMVRAVNRWDAYHEKFHAASHRTISSKFLDLNYIALLLMVVSSTVISVQHVASGKAPSLFHLAKELVYCICVYYIHLVWWVWLVTCSLITKSAELLRISFIEFTSSLTTPEVISQHRALWLELHACAVDLSAALSSTFQAWKVTLFSTVVLATYGLVVSVYTYNYDLILTLGITICSIHAMAFTTYSCGYFAQKALGQNMLSAIVCRRWCHLSTRSLMELELLLESMEMERPPFEIRGFYFVDRRTHVKMLELLITYLVVVVQLKQQSVA